MDPGIGISEDKLPYLRGREMDVFLRSPVTGRYLVANVWPGFSVFPDWSHPNTTEYWSMMLEEFRKNVPFDGLWVDMNEPSNFCDGECGASPLPNEFSNHTYITDLIELTYYPGERNPSEKTIYLETKHYDGSTQFNQHNLFGYYNSKASYEYLQNKGSALPFVLSRATFPGSGKYSTHWTGDNESSFYSMKLSVVGLMNFNVF
jgi:alpha-glucosidase (family GH31 glycosyl hydrolase)